MENIFIGLGLALAVIALFIIAFKWVYAPSRTKSLAKKFAQFRKDFQPTHDAIDAEFNHQEFRSANIGSRRD